MSFPAIFNLSDLNGANGFVIKVPVKTMSSDNIVSGVGDVNGDGISDIQIYSSFNLYLNDYSAIMASSAQTSSTNYILFGQKKNYSATVKLLDLEFGSEYYYLSQLASGLSTGIGDINNDQIDDVILSLSSFTSSSFALFGTKNWLSYNVSSQDFGVYELFSANGLGFSGGIKIKDVNGDKIDDIAMGQYVIYGNNNMPRGIIFNPNILNGANGFQVVNGDSGSGIIGGIGDLNADGINDLITYVNNYPDPSNYAIIYGSKNFGKSFDIKTIDGTNGFYINIDTTPNSNIANSILLGDVNGDKVDDTLLQISKQIPGSYFETDSYVIFGSNSGFSLSFNLSTINGNNGFVVNGTSISSFNSLMQGVGAAGDINCDGINEIIIGDFSVNPPTPYAGVGSGQVYIIYGSKNPFSKYFHLTTLDGRNGFTINGTNQNSPIGMFTDGVGDFNGDGVGDLILGRNMNAMIDSEAYVVFGQCETYEDI